MDTEREADEDHKEEYGEPMEEYDDHKGEYEELHGKIEEGDIHWVKGFLQDENPGQPLCFKGTSALKRSFDSKELRITTFLIHFGAVFRNDDEAEGIDVSEEDVGLLNNLLWYFNKKAENFCVHKLMTLSEFPSDSNDVLVKMYQDLYESECVRLLMKVIESEYPCIVYDFSSENIDRIYFGDQSGLSGITVPETNTIYVGAALLKSGDPGTVKGVVAEEFCHLALKCLFGNVGKPYKEDEESSEKGRKFQDLVSLIESYAEETEDLTPVIRDVFNEDVYRVSEREYELIARVPHLMGIYGECEGRHVLQKSSELKQLLQFYDDYVLPECRRYTDQSYQSRPILELESLHKKKGFLSAEEKGIEPLRDAFEKYLVPNDSIQVLHTNCAKLAALHIYHELKKEIVYHMDKVCLFFTEETFEENKEKICHAFASELCRYLILVINHKPLDTIEKRLGFEIGGNGNPKVMVVSIYDNRNSKCIHYKWSDVSFGIKEFCLERNFYFNGTKCKLKEYLDVQMLPNVFSEKELMNLIDGKEFQVNDGKGLYSHGYDPETYIQRVFQTITADEKILRNVPLNTCIFLSGLSVSELQQLSINEEEVQWIQDSEDEIKDGKSIFVLSRGGSIKFMDCQRKIQTKSIIWLHHVDKVFYLRNTDLSDDLCKELVKRITLSETEMLNLLEKKKIVIISDNAGCGKSTVTSSLIRGVKETFHHSWLWRTDFNEFSMGKENPLSLANIDADTSDEDVSEYLFLMLGLNNGFEKHLFRKFSKRGCCFIFFDGFDEIPSKYVGNALKLLSFVSEKTDVSMIVTTRKHQQVKLEELLNRSTHHLVPFSRGNQVAYLDKFWKRRLSYPFGEVSKKNQRTVEEKIKRIIEESERRETKTDPEYEDLIFSLKKIECEGNLDYMISKIYSLDFTKLARNVIERTLLDDGILEFMGIPLHLYMVGIILFNANFNKELELDIFHLYEQFIEQKILIYIEEKEGIIKESKLKEAIVNSKRKDAYRIHMTLAFQSMDRGMLCSASELDEDDLELCSAFGIVFIHRGRIQFIHNTFAEFFLAEYARKMVTKEVFLKTISQPDYNVLRRLLSSALREKNFENIKRGLFEDLDFLMDLMDRILHRFSCYRIYVSDSDNLCCFSIVKKLLTKFEAIDITKDLVDKFVDALHGLVMSKSDREKYKFCHGIGGCLTFHTLGSLLTRDFVLYSKTIFSFVRVSDNAQKVIDFLKAYNSIKSDGGLWFGESSKRVNCEDGERIADCILDLLTDKDTNGDGIILYALCNENGAIFARLLEFFRIALGIEKFKSAIVQSSQYMQQVRKYIENVPPNRICGTLEELHSVFGDEMGILLDKDCKSLLFDRALLHDEIYERSDSLNLVTTSFLKCFGREESRVLLLSRDSRGEYLMHKLIYCTGRVGKYLSLIKDVLNDKREMLGFLRSINGQSRSALRLAAEEGLCLGEFLHFCGTNFDEGHIKDLLLEEDELDCLFWSHCPKMTLKNLKLIEETVADDDWFRKLLNSKTRQFQNTLHLAALQYDLHLDDLLRFCNAHFHIRQTKEMLISTVEYDRNVMHHLVLYNAPETLMKNLETIKETVRDEEWFTEFLKCKDGYNRNSLHLAAMYRNMYLDDLLRFYDANLRKEELKGMLTSESDENVIRLLVMRNSSGILEKNLKLVCELIGDAQWFMDILEQEGMHDGNLFHFVAQNGREIDLSAFDLFLDEAADGLITDITR